MDVLTKPDLAEKVAAARARLDAHVREIVAWHFDPETGSPFWLERAAGLGFDPRKEVQGYDDLQALRPLRGLVAARRSGAPLDSAAAWPAGRRTSSRPAARPGCRSRGSTSRTSRSITSGTATSCPRTASRAGADWLMLGPTGPRRLRLAVEHLAQHRGGICFHVDLDPRWVNRLIKDGRHRELQEYKAHVIEQGLTVLRAHEIRCLFTTPKLLEALCERVSLVKLGIRGIFCGGTEMNAQFHRFAREELVPGIEFIPTYGNTLMGLACPKPFDPADNSPTVRDHLLSAVAARRLRAGRSEGPGARRSSTGRPGG